MKITGLEISNYRGIEHVQMNEIGDLVVIAGPNGTGKSCVLDAIRTVKSHFGPYQANEWDLWAGEFMVNQARPWEQIKLLRDREQPAEIKVWLELSRREEEYLQGRSRELMLDIALKKLFPAAELRHIPRLKQQIPTFDQTLQTRVKNLNEYLLQHLDQELQQRQQLAYMQINQRGEIIHKENLVLAALWPIYLPDRLGVIDYHGSHRNYMRENVKAINLSLETQEEQQKQHALYNSGNKYTSIKADLTTEFVQDILRQEGGGKPQSQSRTLRQSLEELFRTFFPGKEFAGVQVDAHGNPNFPVKTGIAKHDIDELSSGEKEILYGYLRLRKSAPRDSIVLIDEPELHLNPKLIHGLPQFYERHLVRGLNNQMWLVTHSDTLLREALGTSNATVFHMQEAKDAGSSWNQLKKIEHNQDEKHAVIELVGDLAGYRPEGKVVIFEGRHNGIDVEMTRRLFPSYDRKMNFIAGGSRKEVEQLHRSLEAKGGEPVYSVVDKDLNSEVRKGSGRYQWDAYHIENYLLDETYILHVLQDITVIDASLLTASSVREELLKIAKTQVNTLSIQQLKNYVYNNLKNKLKLGNQELLEENLVENIRKSAKSSVETMATALDDELTKEMLENQMKECKERLEYALRTESWKRVFRGRDILRKFSAEHCNGVRYERLRDMIVNKMAQNGYQPEGMLKVLMDIDQNPRV